MTPEMVAMVVLGGLLAGGLGTFVLKGGGHGMMTDVILGLAGGIVGSWIFQALGISPGAGFFALVVVGFMGAAILIVAQRKFWPTTA